MFLEPLIISQGRKCEQEEFKAELHLQRHVHGANSIAWQRQVELFFVFFFAKCKQLFFSTLQGKYLACLLWIGPLFSSVHLWLFGLSGAELWIISVKSHTSCLLCLKQSERNKQQQIGLTIFWWMVSNLPIYHCKKKLIEDNFIRSSMQQAFLSGRIVQTNAWVTSMVDREWRRLKWFCAFGTA